MFPIYGFNFKYSYAFNHRKEMQIMADFTVRDKITLDELSDSLRNLVTYGDGSLTIDKTLSTI